MTAGVCEVEIENGKFFSGGSEEGIDDKRIVECSGGLATNCIVLGSAIAKDDQVKVKEVKEEEVVISGVCEESLNCEIGRCHKVFVDKTQTDSQNNDIVPILIFPHKFVSPQIPIYFGSFEVPKSDDDKKPKEEIKNARLQLVEKIKCRNSIIAEIKEKRAIVESSYATFETARLEVIAARKLLKSKKPELDSIQSLINKVKKAEDIDNNIHEVEHMKETINQKYKIEELLNNLEKEIISLKDNVSKAEANALTTRKTYEEENKKGKELLPQFQVADEVCQQAYEHLISLKKRLYHKKKASDFASSGDKIVLGSLCANQVDKFMEENNTNDEFREDYSNNIRPSTTDETLHMNDTSERVAMNSSPLVESIPLVSKVEHVKTIDETLHVNDTSEKIATNSGLLMETIPMVPKVEQVKKTVSPYDYQTMGKVARKTNRMLKTREPLKFIVRDSKFVCLSELMENEEKEKIAEEVDRKEDESSKKEIECKLKERIRSEDKKKINEAVKRKTRNAKNVQKQAELQAEREARQKEKAREKRLRKKERRTRGDSSSSSRMNDEMIVKPNETNEIEKPVEVEMAPTSVRWPWKAVTSFVRHLCSL